MPKLINKQELREALWHTEQLLGMIKPETHNPKDIALCLRNSFNEICECYPEQARKLIKSGNYWV